MRLRLADVSSSVVCSRQRTPRKTKSKYRWPVSGRGRILATAHSPGGHGDRWSLGRRVQFHVALDGFPNVENLPAPERPEVVDAFEEHCVLEAVSDGARV